MSAHKLTAIVSMLLASTCGSVLAADVSVHSSHRYYQDATGKPLFFIGYYDWAAVPDGFFIDQPSSYANEMNQDAPYKINYIRISLGVNRHTASTNPPSFNGQPTPVPFLYNGSGKADLNQWDNTFWTGLANQCSLAASKGIIVHVAFFDGVEIRSQGGAAYGYSNSFWKPSNQAATFYANPDFNGNGQIDDSGEFYQLTNFNNDTGIGHYQRLLISKAITTLASFNNVFYEVGNELLGSDVNWNSAVVNYIKSLTVKPVSQVGGTAVGNIDGYSDHVGDTSGQVKSFVASFVGHGYPGWVDPDGPALSDFGVSPDVLRQAAWYSFAGGAANWGGFTVDFWNQTFNTTTVGYYKNLQQFVQDSGVHFENMVPRHDLISNGGSTNSCLANVGVEYVAYVLSDASINLDLTSVAGSIGFRIYDPRANTWSGKLTATGGGVRSFSKPGAAADWVVYVGPGGPAGPGFANSDFESGFGAAGGGYNGNKGNNWTPYVYSGTPSNFTFSDETGAGNVDGGAHSQKIQSAAGTEGGVYNQIDVVNGQWYNITVRVKSGSPAAWCFFGINTSGGIDSHESSGTIYPYQNSRSTSWQTASWTGQATGNKITLFLDTYDGVGYWDTATPVVSTVQSPFGGSNWAIPGTIQAENFDNGGEGVAYHDLSSGNLGGAYRSTDVDVENTGDTGGGYNVGFIDTGEWYEYTVNVASAGSYDINMRVASPNTGASYHIEMNGANVTGTRSVPNTGGWQTWQTITASSIALNVGVQVMRVAVDGGGWNFNYVTFQTAVSQTPFGGTNRTIPGTIQAEDFDNGGEGVAYHDNDAANNGGGYRTTGVDIEATSDTGGGFNVGWTGAGEWLEYTVNVTNTGDHTFKLRVADCCNNSTVHLEMNGQNITGSKSFASTGGWQNWTTVMFPAVFLNAGNNQILRLYVEGGDTNINKIDVTYGGSDAVSEDLGPTNVDDGMTHPQPGDGHTASASIGGHQCRVNVNNAVDFYFYFAVSDVYAFQGNRPNVWITLDYYDTGTGSLTLQYDATSSAYKSGPSVTLTNSNTWKSVSWNVIDAYFGNRENNGADFRIFRGTNQTFYLDAVQVSPLQP